MDDKLLQVEEYFSDNSSEDDFEIRNIKKNSSFNELGKSKYFQKKILTIGENVDADLKDLKLILGNKKKPKRLLEGSKVKLRSNKDNARLALPSLSDFEDLNETDESNEIGSIADSFDSQFKIKNLSNTNKAKNAYTLDEDNKMLSFILENGRYTEIKGNKLWKDMQEQKVLTGRTWQSMKERFLKAILGNILNYSEMYKIDQKDLEYLQNCSTDKQVKKTTSKPESVLSSNYSIQEDEDLLKTILRLHDDNSLTGVSIWKDCETNFYRHFKHKRSWQSLKERFIKRIVPKLHQYKSIKNYSQAQKIISSVNLSQKAKNDIIQQLKKRFEIES